MHKHANFRSITSPLNFFLHSSSSFSHQVGFHPATSSSTPTGGFLAAAPPAHTPPLPST
jgi:hypothetical protein